MNNITRIATPEVAKVVAIVAAAVVAEPLLLAAALGAAFVIGGVWLGAQISNGRTA